MTEEFRYHSHAYFFFNDGLPYSIGSYREYKKIFKIARTQFLNYIEYLKSLKYFVVESTRRDDKVRDVLIYDYDFSQMIIDKKNLNFSALVRILEDTDEDEGLLKEPKFITFRALVQDEENPKYAAEYWTRAKDHVKVFETKEEMEEYLLSFELQFQLN